MPSIKEIDEAIDASINSVTVDSPDYVDYSKSCAENDSKFFAEKLKATIESIIKKSGEDNYLSSDPMMIQSNELKELFTSSILSAKVSKAKKLTPESLSKVWCINQNMVKDALECNTHLN